MDRRISRRALKTRARFFSALRVLSLRDETTARVTRRVEHDVDEVIFQIERFANVGSEEGRFERAIAGRWIAIAGDCMDVDPDLADLVTLFARHWLLRKVPHERATDWIVRAEACVWALSLRGEHQFPTRRNRTIESDQPLVTLVLRGLPRLAQPLDVELDLGDGARIGRADDCDWVLPGESVSRHHLALRWDGAKRTFFVRNLSKNGIAIPDAGIVCTEEEEVELPVGCTIYVPKEGHYKILVQSIFVPMPSSPAVTDPELAADLAPEMLEDEISLDDAAAPSLTGEEKLGPQFLKNVVEQYPFLGSDSETVLARYVLGGGDAAPLVDLAFHDIVAA